MMQKKTWYLFMGCKTTHS